MSKYGEAIGIWSPKVGGFDLDLHPKKGDNYRLSKILSEAKQKGEGFVLEQIGRFVTELIKREHPPADEKETEELENAVEFNLIEWMKEIMVAFRWAKKEDMDKLEAESTKDILKKAGQLS